MTDDERWKIVGRTIDLLREAKHRQGVLRAEIAEHAHKLKEASDALTFFLSDPCGTGPTGMNKPDYLAAFFRNFVNPTIEEKLRELAREAERVKELEKQIAEF